MSMPEINRWVVRVVTLGLVVTAWVRLGWVVGAPLLVLALRAEMSDQAIMHIGVGHHRILGAIEAIRKGAAYADAAKRIGRS